MSFSGLPALDINPLKIGAEINQTQAQTALINQQVTSSKQQNDVQSQLAPYQIQSAKTKSLQDAVTAANDQLAQVARDAQAADPEDAPNIWDQGMREASANGVTHASQYIGHYRPDLAERLSDIYGGGSPQSRQASGGSTAGGGDAGAIDRAVASMPPQQLQTSLSRLNRAITSFNQVKDQATWDQEIQTLKEAGFNLDRVLPSTEWNPMNYAAAARVLKGLVPYRDAMASRAAILQAGATPPAPAPIGTSQYIGTEPGTSKPVYHNTTTGEDTLGANPVGPKPSAAISTLMAKQQAWLAVHPGDQQGALEFANGKRSMDAVQMQTYATSEANKSLADVTLAGQVIPDPESWVRTKSAEILGQLQSASAGPANVVPPPSQLPQRAIDTVKAAGGNVVQFNNGLKYKWDAKTGRAVQVQ